MQLMLTYIVYFLALVFFIYALLQFRLGFYFLKSRRRIDFDKPINNKENLPKVTIQLPLYNEKHVVSDLLEAVLNINYPKELLEVQVLDDSTDQTSIIIDDFLIKNQSEGFNFYCLRRKNRKGYKAGALQEGLKLASGDYIAIFDADFIPPKDFIYKTLPLFDKKNIAFVQTRWGHINEKESLLTGVQAFGLDMHFTVEQGGRFFSGDFIQFNGTGGIFRKHVIDEAGGWSGDTITEDLDLSFRIQLLNYQGVYASNIICPAELPSTLEALRIQQTRWIGGGAGCFNKLLKRIILSSNIPFNKRVFALFHLFHSSMFLFVFAMLLISIASGLFSEKLNGINAFAASMIFSFSLFSLIFIYAISFWFGRKRKFIDIPMFFICFFMFIALNFGFSFNHFIAIINGYRKKMVVFNRTPKNNGEKKNASYLALEKRRLIEIMEWIIFLVLAVSFFLSIQNGDYKFVFIYVFALFGYGWVVYRSVRNLFLWKQKDLISNSA